MPKLLEYFKTYEGGYRVSYGGRVYTPKGKECRQRTLPKGYKMVTINAHGRQRLGMSVHRLVALCFVPNPDPERKTQVDHIAGDPSRNSADGLRWVTDAENKKAKYEQRAAKGLPRYTARELAARERAKEKRGKRCVYDGVEYRSIRDLARWYGVRRQAVRDALKRGWWHGKRLEVA